MTIPAHVPEAPVAKYTPMGIVVDCPYCHGRHVHPYPHGRTRPAQLHRGPGCGLYRSGEDRVTGYRIDYQPKEA